jgi:glucokinase
MTAPQAIGVDFGATKIASALVTTAGDVKISRTTLTRKEEGVASVLARIAGEINNLSRDADGDVLGIGIGVPGVLKPAEGILVYAHNLEWNYVELVDELHASMECKAPVWIQTDANVCILGEYYFGAARGCKDMLYTSIGSGLGGAILSNGTLVTGINNAAGFLGLYSLDPEGRPDPSGLRGNTETVVSGRGLVALTRALRAQKRFPTGLADSKDLAPELILEAAQEGDELAAAALAEMGRYLGMIWTPAVAVLNPGAIVLAGGLGLAAFDLLVPAAWEEIHRRLTPISYAEMSIVRSELESSAVGAACLAFETTGAFSGLA